MRLILNLHLPTQILTLDVEDPRLIRFRTFSKAYGMAGMRVGYALGEERLICCI